MYRPTDEIIKKYAQVMVHYAINNGRGINKGETVFLNGMESSKQLFEAIYKEIVLAGGNVISQYSPDSTKDGITRFLLENGTDEQLSYFPEPFWKGVVDTADHLLAIISYPDVHALEGVPSEKVGLRSASFSKYMEMRRRKEEEGKMTWTLCLFGTQSSADEAGMSLEEYWEQIAQACYLHEEDPVAKWKQTQLDINEVKSKLDAMEIQKVHINGEGVDLEICIGEQRKWLGGTGQNIPSFEVFISPDWRGTNGTIRFNQPLYYTGKRISGIALQFENGLVVKSSAAENEEALKEMISKENADKIGEFSMTDRRHSRITKFMANTLFDENTGGEYGNSHIALGNAYRTAYTGNVAEMTDEKWEVLGFNNCPKVHTDIITTKDRTITATLKDGTEMVIYKDGQFTFI